MHLSDSDWEYVEERARDFTGRAWVFERVRSFLASDARMLVIVAPPGTGKTAIAARLAQASAGRLGDEPARPLAAGTLDAAIFCQAGQVNLLGVAQDLARQLATLPGFTAEILSTVASKVDISGTVTAQVLGDNRGNVAAVNIYLAALGPEHAFADGLALPLRRLSEKPGFRPPVLLVDSLHEAYASPVATSLPRSLADLVGARLILTTGRDPRVLAAFRLRAEMIDLVSDAPPGNRDLEDYVLGLLAAEEPDPAIRHLAHRIDVAASGNFLYARYVTQSLVDGHVIDDLDVARASRVHLPAGGLAGVYHEYLGRDLGSDEVRWAGRVAPILGPLAVAQGGGLDTNQLAPIASEVTDRPLSRDDARTVTRQAGLFLEGDRPDGPFRPYHRSFAEFLVDPVDNPDWAIDARASHLRIVTGLRTALPRGPSGGPAWSSADAYTRAHLAYHAAEAGILDELVTDVGFLAVADIQRLLPFLPQTHSNEAREWAAIIELVWQHLRQREPGDRASYLELAARQRGAGNLAERVAERFPDRPWHSPGAWWRQPTRHVQLLGHDGPVVAIATGVLDSRPIAVSGGADGTIRLWDLEGRAPIGGPLAAHLGDVGAIALGPPDDSPIAVTGGDDGIIRVWNLAEWSQNGEPIVTGHDRAITSITVAALGGRPIVVSSGGEGGIRVWDLEDRAQIGEVSAGSWGGITDADLVSQGDRQMIASASMDYQIRLWDLEDRSQIGGALTGHDGPAMAVAFGAVGHRLVLVTGGFDGTVRLWDLDDEAPTGQPMASDRGPEDFWAAQRFGQRVRTVAIGALGGAPVAVSGNDVGEIRLWDLEQRTQIGRTAHGHIGQVNDVAIAKVHGEPVVVSGGDDGTVRQWAIGIWTDGTTPGEIDDVAIASVAVGNLRGQPCAVTGSDDGTIQLWDLDEPAGRYAALKGHDGPVRALAIGALEGRSFAVSGGEDGSVRLWDLEDWTPAGEPLGGHEGPVTCVAVGVFDGRTVAITGGDDATVRLWDVASPTGTGQPLERSVIDVLSPIMAIGLGKLGGRMVAISGGDDYSVRLWDLADREMIGQPLEGQEQSYSVTALALGTLHDRPIVVGGEEFGMVRTWTLEEREPIILSNASSDGDPWSPMRDLARDQPVPPPADDGEAESLDRQAGHAGAVSVVALGSLGGRMVALSGGDDATVRLWDPLSGTERAVVDVGSAVSSIAMGDKGLAVVACEAGLIAIRFSTTLMSS